MTAEQAVREAAATWEVKDTQAEGILESGLGSALGVRYAARGDEADLDQAIDLVTPPWRESRPASSPRRRSRQPPEQSGCLAAAPL